MRPPQARAPSICALRPQLPHAGYLVLRLRSYPAWQVKVNGQPAASLPLRDDGLMAVPVPQGPVDVTVDWTATPDVILGALAERPECAGCSQAYVCWSGGARALGYHERQ